MVKPEETPNVVAARLRMAVVFPHAPGALISRLRSANVGKALPTWREDQLVNFAKILALYAADLSDAFNNGRVDLVGMASRNLAELRVWVFYCNLSEAHARRFCEDSVRDLVDILETLEKAFTARDEKLKVVVTQYLDSLRQIAVSSGMRDVGPRFTQVHKAANEVGQRDEFAHANKIFSKVVHPTSLVLTLGHEQGALGSMIGALYLGGVDFALSTFSEIVKYIDNTLGPQGLAVGQQSNTPASEPPNEGPPTGRV